MLCVSISADGRRVVSGSYDKTVRIWNADTHEQIGEVPVEHSRAVDYVSESNDGCHIVYRCYYDDNRIIWNSENRAIVWNSEKAEVGSQNDVTDEGKHSETDTTDGEDAFENEITNDEAEKIIRSCGHHTPHLWPESFPAYSSELYCDNESAYSNLDGEKTLIADNIHFLWTYNAEKKVFAARTLSGSVAICRFVTK